jgi:hypothetical protein
MSTIQENGRYTIAYIRQWRGVAHSKGQPCTLRDFYAAHHRCMYCQRPAENGACFDHEECRRLRGQPHQKQGANRGNAYR